MCMLEPTEARKGHLVSWDWSSRDCELPSGYWEPNPGLLATGGNALNPQASCLALNFFFFFLKEIVYFYKAKPQIITTNILILVHASFWSVSNGLPSC